MNYLDIDAVLVAQREPTNIDNFMRNWLPCDTEIILNYANSLQWKTQLL